MNQHSPLSQALLAPVTTSFSIATFLRELLNNEQPTSTLGPIISASHREAIAARWSEFRFALSCHALSEFPYQPSPIDSTDEPLCFRLQRCNHGLTSETCAPCIRLSQSGVSKQRGSSTRRFQTMDKVSVGVKKCSGFAHNDGFRKALITRVVAGFEDFSGYYSPSKDGRKLRLMGTTLAELPTAPIEFSCPLRVESKFTDALALAAYAVLHLAHGKEQFTGFTNWCTSCFEYVEQNHGCEEWQAKKKLAAKKQAAKFLVERKQAAKMIAKKREVREQRRRTALIADGYWSSDRRDLVILAARKGTIEAEAVTKFDCDLSRKGNKWRVQ
jgi:hypothetical protein